MTLILLAISLSITLCVLAYNFAIYALPFMVGLTAFQHVYGAGAGFLMSGLAAIGAALASVALVIAVLGFARNPALRLLALAVFAIPAAIAGYALVYGVTKNATDSATLDLELTFAPAENADAENAPAYRIHLGDEDGPEVGAGWKHTGERAGAFISVLLDDPVFPQPIRARLFQSDEDGRDWGLHWTRQKKRDEQE